MTRYVFEAVESDDELGKQRSAATRTGSGRLARFGFRFSDLVLIKRALTHLKTRRAAKISGTAAPISPVFRVESPAATGAPDWDIQEDHGDALVIDEVKSGRLSADDRREMWKRIRRTAVALDSSGARSIALRLTTNAANPTTHPDTTVHNWVQSTRPQGL